MPIQAKPTKYAFYTEGEEITEQEHKDSCDINIMMKNVERGYQVRGGSTPIYGHDDTTMTPMILHQEKQRLEEELGKAPKEMDEDQLALIPPAVQKKFGFKKKQSHPANAKNDDSTTKNANGDPDPAHEHPEPGTAPKKPQ